MSIYRDKTTGRWRFDFDRYLGGVRARKRRLLPAGWTRAQAEAYDRKEGAALSAILEGIAKPRHTVDEAVRHYLAERGSELKHAGNLAREIEATRDWWTGRAIEELPAVCAEYAADQLGALAPATIKKRGRRQGITDVHDKMRVEYAQAAEPPMPMGWLESPHGAFRANPLVRVSMPPETLAWQIPLYFAPPKREPLPEREIKDICHMNGWDDSYQSMRFARAVERAHGIGDE